jgi:hypothetical protein
MRPVILFLFVCSIARADTVSDLKATLARLDGSERVKANVSFEFSSRNGDPKQPILAEGRASAEVEDGPDGLRIFWRRDVVDAAAREVRAQGVDPEAPTPTRSAIEQLGTTALSDYFDGAAELLRTLEQAQFVEEKPETWNGQLARLLSFKLTPRMSEKDRKFIKELEATAKVWVDANGLPLGAESSVYVRGRAMLVIGFESTQHEQYRFAPVGNRLLVVEHVSESSGSGGGESGQRRSLARLTVAEG